MSISLGVYEFFSYVLPGILYLYVGNEFIGFMSASKLELSQIGNVEAIFLLGVAYLIGHIMNVVCEFLWRNLGRKERRLRNLPDISLERLRRKFNGINIDFKKDEWDFLLNRLRQDETELASHFERFKAVSLMLRNTALALYLWAVVYIIEFVLKSSLAFLLNALVLIILGLLSSQRSRVFDLWFYNGVYSEGLRFGRSIQEILLNDSKTKPKQTRTRRNVAK